MNAKEWIGHSVQDLLTVIQDWSELQALSVAASIHVLLPHDGTSQGTNDNFFFTYITTVLSISIDKFRQPLSLTLIFHCLNILTSTSTFFLHYQYQVCQIHTLASVSKHIT